MEGKGSGELGEPSLTVSDVGVHSLTYHPLSTKQNLVTSIQDSGEIDGNEGLLESPVLGGKWSCEFGVQSLTGSEFGVHSITDRSPFMGGEGLCEFGVQSLTGSKFGVHPLTDRSPELPVNSPLSTIQNSCTAIHDFGLKSGSPGGDRYSESLEWDGYGSLVDSPVSGGEGSCEFDIDSLAGHSPNVSAGIPSPISKNVLVDKTNVVALHEAVLASKVPNFQGLRIPLETKLNIPFFRKELVEYHDKEVVELMEFGFPLGMVGDIPSNPPGVNHGGAIRFPRSVGKYLKTELQEGAVLGPFKSNPFSPSSFSPLSTTEKSDSVDRRVIMDLSYPIGHSVNDLISTSEYLGAPMRLRYPSVDDLVKLIKQKGRGCALMKRDLARAFRQFPVDPGDMHVLGFAWEGNLYFDKTLPMGLRSSPLSCQRITNAVRHIFQGRGFDLVNYLDDLVTAEKWEMAEQADEEMGQVLIEGGLVEKPSKHIRPVVEMVFLGVLHNTETLTLAVSQERLLELSGLLSDWLDRSRASRRDFQVLLGKLNFVASCVRQGRVFVARIINHMKTISHSGTVSIPEFVRRDLRWWKIFLPLYNGVSMMAIENWAVPDEVFATDACLLGCGGWSEDRRYFHSPFPDTICKQSIDINGLELLTIIIACKVWGRGWKGKRMLVHCDNMVSVIVMNTGKTSDLFLQACLREIAFLAATREFEIRGVHIPGVSNRVPDALSRWDLDDKFPPLFRSLVGPEPVFEVDVHTGLFEFLHILLLSDKSVQLRGLLKQVKLSKKAAFAEGTPEST